MHALGFPPRQTHPRARAIRHRRVKPRARCASTGWVRRLRVVGRFTVARILRSASRAHVHDGHSFHCRADACMYIINSLSSTQAAPPIQQPPPSFVSPVAWPRAQPTSFSPIAFSFPFRNPTLRKLPTGCRARFSEGALDNRGGAVTTLAYLTNSNPL